MLHQIHQSWAGLFGRFIDTVENLLDLRLAEVAIWVPAITFQIYPAIVAEDNALDFQELAHSIR